jgi:hypothetical protein
MQVWTYSREGGWLLREQEISAKPCPSCGGSLVRVRQRIFDRLFSPTKHRFSCQSRNCFWQGNRPAEQYDHKAAA